MNPKFKVILPVIALFFLFVFVSIKAEASQFSSVNIVVDGTAQVTESGTGQELQYLPWCSPFIFSPVIAALEISTSVSPIAPSPIFSVVAAKEFRIHAGVSPPHSTLL
jgi:hypothetical protein